MGVDADARRFAVVVHNHKVLPLEGGRQAGPSRAAARQRVEELRLAVQTDANKLEGAGAGTVGGPLRGLHERLGDAAPLCALCAVALINDVNGAILTLNVTYKRSAALIVNR